MVATAIHEAHQRPTILNLLAGRDSGEYWDDGYRDNHEDSEEEVGVWDVSSLLVPPNRAGRVCNEVEGAADYSRGSMGESFEGNIELCFSVGFSN